MVAVRWSCCSPLAGSLLCALLVTVGCSNCESAGDGDAGFDDGAVDAAAADTGSGDTWQRECESNTDCAAPTSVCDTIKGRCVECLVLGDCVGKPGAVCSLGACTCPIASETWCAADLCVDLQVSSEHCGRCGHRCFGSCRDGRCVDPWEPISEVGAPEARAMHVAVWTGSEMVVWGGANGGATDQNLDSGGIYDPASGVWRATSQVGAPSPRRLASAVWTGTEMLVWGGYHDDAVLGTGGRFDPGGNSWRPIATAGAPAARMYHSAVWTGTAMIVWGGDDRAEQLADGASYDPVADRWTSIPTPAFARSAHSAVWLDDAMLIYGGVGDAGAETDVYFPTAAAVGGWSFKPATGAWTPLTAIGQPAGRAYHTAAAVDGRMVVWGGHATGTNIGDGATYSASGWVDMASPQPSPRRFHSAVVVGHPTQVIVWGGLDDLGVCGSGAAFDPLANSWTTLPAVLSARRNHTAVSTGASMIVWGGQDSSARLGDGAIYTLR